MQKATNAKKGFTVPHILLIIGGIILLSCLCTYIAPTGSFDMDESGRVIPGTFHAVERVGISPWQALLMVMEGIQNASSIIAMMLVAGGSIECVIATGAFTDILNFGIFKLKDKSVTVLVPSIVVLMSAIGACGPGFPDRLRNRGYPDLQAIKTGPDYGYGNVLSGLPDRTGRQFHIQHGHHFPGLCRG